MESTLSDSALTFFDFEYIRENWYFLEHVKDNIFVCVIRHRVGLVAPGEANYYFKYAREEDVMVGASVMHVAGTSLFYIPLCEDKHKYYTNNLSMNVNCLLDCPINNMPGKKVGFWNENKLKKYVTLVTGEMLLCNNRICSYNSNYIEGNKYPFRMCIFND